MSGEMPEQQNTAKLATEADSTDISTELSRMDKGKGKAKAVEPEIEDEEEDDDEGDDDDEDDDEEDEEILDEVDAEEDFGEIDPSNIVYTGRRRNAPLDYSSEEAIKQAGLDQAPASMEQEEEDPEFKGDDIDEE